MPIATATLAEIVRLTARLPGWCSFEKAVMLADLVQTNRARVVVEVGLFGGRSFFPMVLAMQALGEGCVYGIDAFSTAVAVETPTSAENDEWWAALDLVGIKRQFLEYLIEMRLEKYAAVIELPSDEAVAAFSTPRFKGQIDLVHVDGAHASGQALRDLQQWSGLLRPGGHLVADDIAWPSMQAGRTWLNATHELIREMITDQVSYAVYRKPSA